MSEYGTRLFGTRLFAGRLWRAPMAVGAITGAATGGVAARRYRSDPDVSPVVGVRRRIRDADELLFLTRR